MWTHFTISRKFDREVPLRVHVESVHVDQNLELAGPVTFQGKTCAGRHTSCSRPFERRGGTFSRGSVAYQAMFQFRQFANYRPHGAD
jgi:hypothetical protein